MEIKNLEKVLRLYIADVIHTSLATSANNKPWVCEVHFSFDDELNLYFRSRSNTRHSKEIAANQFVAGNIVEQHGKGQKPRGVYFEGTCEELVEVTLQHPAYKTYSERFGLGPELIDEAKNSDGHKFYKITVTDYYLFDSRESSPSRKYHLSWHKPNGLL